MNKHHVIHELKIWPECFRAMASGEKSFEYRKNDRNFQVHEILWLREWDPSTEKYTGDYGFFEVTYILTSCHGLPDGYCIMQTRLVRRLNAEWRDVSRWPGLWSDDDFFVEYRM